jgi:cytochrome P450
MQCRELEALAAREAETMPLAELDVSRADRFQTNTHWSFFARLRREDPVHFCAESLHGPYWSITRYDDIIAVEKDYRRFSSEGNIIIGDVPAEFDAPAFATADPPVHTRERKAVVPALSPKRLATLETSIRANIGAVLDGLPRNESFDWVERVSDELTTLMVATLFDFPLAERRLLAYWAEVLVTTPQPGAVVATWAEREAIIEEYRAWIMGMWRKRAIGSPRDDIISSLAHNPSTATMIDDPLHLLGTVTMLAGANEAARGALSGGVIAFNRFPGEWEKLRANPALLPNAASEIVRWQTPISHMRRTALEDLEFRGKLIRKGERVVMWYCSGNRDENCFEDGDALRIERSNARRHLAYGFGIHRCVGSHVAEMQTRILWEEILVRFKRIELTGEPKYKASNFSAGHDEVPVRISP